MGYRFTLESANIVANLTFGKVMSCYRDIYSSEESYHVFMDFLDRFPENIYSNRQERYIRSAYQIRKILLDNKNQVHRRSIEKTLHYHDETLKALSELSTIFNRCAVKSLLLPKMSKYNDRNNYDRDFMISEETLPKLLSLHEGDSCLILQPQETPKQVAIFDAFPNFEIALRQIDLWPAVLFWSNSKDFTFVPIKDENELLNLYKIVKYERKPIGELRRFAEQKKKPCHYIFQLSDLHFGAKNIYIAERRLKSLVKTQLYSIDFDDSTDFLITGDAVDSPKLETENNYRNFSEYLEEHYGKKPIRVLGNHDINSHGLAIFHGRQQIADIVGSYPKIEVLDEPKVILLLFNSNTNGNFAKGEIGIAQMAEMGNLLDEKENLSDYLLIAVMHHHLLPIPQPDYYSKKWYERILPNSLLDKSLELIDADLFIEWLIKRNIKFVLHGHKHIPFMTEHKGINVISCGSSTGKINHKEKGKTYMSYNLLKITENTVTVTQFAEEVCGAGAKNIKPEIVFLKK
jgi:predicted phosphodiesterase